MSFPQNANDGNDNSFPQHFPEDKVKRFLKPILSVLQFMFWIICSYLRCKKGSFKVALHQNVFHLIPLASTTLVKRVITLALHKINWKKGPLR